MDNEVVDDPGKPLADEHKVPASTMKLWNERSVGPVEKQCVHELGRLCCRKEKPDYHEDNPGHIPHVDRGFCFFQPCKDEVCQGGCQCKDCFDAQKEYLQLFYDSLMDSDLDPKLKVETAFSDFPLNLVCEQCQKPIFNVPASSQSRCAKTCTTKDSLVDTDSGVPFVHHAAFYGLTDVVQKVIDLAIANEASFNRPTNAGRTLLMIAALSGNENLFDYLVSHGADVRATTDTTSVLMATTRCFKPEAVSICRKALDAGADPMLPLNNTTPMIAAATMCNDAVLECLLSHESVASFDPNLIYSGVHILTAPLSIPKACGSTVRVALEHKANANTLVPIGNITSTPLILALRHGAAEAASLMLDNGASVNPEGAYPPALLAAIIGTPTLVKRLIDAEANINCLWEGESPLYMCFSDALGENDEVDPAALCEDLIKAGANIELELSDSMNALAKGISDVRDSRKYISPSQVSVALKLLEHGSSTDMNAALAGPNKSKLLPMLHAAAHVGSAELCDALIKNGANVWKKEANHDRDPIVMAAYSGKGSCFKMLLDHQADAKSVDLKTGLTAADILAICAAKDDEVAKEVLHDLGLPLLALDENTDADTPELKRLQDAAPRVTASDDIITADGREPPREVVVNVEVPEMPMEPKINFDDFIKFMDDLEAKKEAAGVNEKSRVQEMIHQAESDAASPKANEVIYRACMYLSEHELGMRGQKIAIEGLEASKKAPYKENSLQHGHALYVLGRAYHRIENEGEALRSLDEGHVVMGTLLQENRDDSNLIPEFSKMCKLYLELGSGIKACECAMQAVHVASACGASEETYAEVLYALAVCEAAVGHFGSAFILCYRLIDRGLTDTVNSVDPTWPDVESLASFLLLRVDTTSTEDIKALKIELTEGESRMERLLGLKGDLDGLNVEMGSISDDEGTSSYVYAYANVLLGDLEAANHNHESAVSKYKIAQKHRYCSEVQLRLAKELAMVDDSRDSGDHIAAVQEYIERNRAIVTDGEGEHILADFMNTKGDHQAAHANYIESAQKDMVFLKERCCHLPPRFRSECTDEITGRIEKMIGYYAENDLLGNPQVCKRVFEIITNLKSSVVESMEEGDPSSEGSLVVMNSALASLRVHQYRLFITGQLCGHTDGSRSSCTDLISTLSRKVEATERNIANARLAPHVLSQDSLKHPSSDRKKIVDPMAISAQLESGTCVLEFVRITRIDRYVVFVIPTTGINSICVVTLADSADAIDDNVSALRRLLGSGGDHDDISSLGCAIRAMVFDPLISVMGSPSRIIVAADGNLREIPFEVLLQESSSPGTHYQTPALSPSDEIDVSTPSLPKVSVVNFEDEREGKSGEGEEAPHDEPTKDHDADHPSTANPKEEANEQASEQASEQANESKEGGGDDYAVEDGNINVSGYTDETINAEPHSLVKDPPDRKRLSMEGVSAPTEADDEATAATEEGATKTENNQPNEEPEVAASAEEAASPTSPPPDVPPLRSPPAVTMAPALPSARRQYLVDKYEFVYVISSAEVSRWKADTTESGKGRVPQKANSTLIVMGGCDYDASARGVSRQGEVWDLDLKSMEGASKEAKAVAQVLGTQARVGTDAIVGRLVQEMTFHPHDGKAICRSVHLATQSYSIGEKFSESGIALSGANAWAKKEEVNESSAPCVLTCSDLMAIDMSNTDLFVISGAASESTKNIQRALTYAGATAVVMAMWNAPHDSSTAILSAMYSSVAKGVTASKSLRMAVLDYLSTHPSESPANWGSLILQGNPKSVRALDPTYRTYDDHIPVQSSGVNSRKVRVAAILFCLGFLFPFFWIFTSTYYCKNKGNRQLKKIGFLSLLFSILFAMLTIATLLFAGVALLGLIGIVVIVIIIVVSV